MYAIFYKNGYPLAGTDSYMRIDGRLKFSNVVASIKRRNKRYEKNLPHLIPDAFGLVRSLKDTPKIITKL